MNTDAKNLKTLSERLIFALDITNTKKSDLARAINVKPQIIQFLCGGSTKSSRFAFEIATALGLNPKWLATGEGEMFLADDLSHKLFSEYQRIPILSHEQLIARYATENIDLSQHKYWEVIKTEESSDFCFKMPDTSMEPNIPLGAFLFFSDPNINSKLSNQDIILAYVQQFNALIVREVNFNSDNKAILLPKNINNFYKTPLTDEIRILGIATDCHWKLNTHRRKKDV